MISNFENLELVTNVNPTLQSVTTKENGVAKIKEVYQFIYASQLYGTTFAVYGRFNIDEVKSNDAMCCINSLDLKLLNYKGVINLGFTNDDLKHEQHQDNNGNIEHIVLFKVRGFSNRRGHGLTFKPNIEVQKGIPLRITFNRLLLPMEGFEEAALDNKLDRANEMDDGLLDSNYFDTEFMERNGTEYYHKPLLPGMLNNRFPEGKKKESNAIVSHRCHQSNVNLYF